LKGTSKSVDQVTIQPDGKWVLNNKKEQPAPTSRMNGVASDSDDDIVEITKSGDSVRMGTPLAYRNPMVAPSQSREPSGPPKSQGSTSGKRPISAVIDLTSSGDEDDEPVRAPKRQFGTNGYGLSSAPIHRPAPLNGYSPLPRP
jgi:E3 SUMO-protein ligase PIAS1